MVKQYDFFYYYIPSEIYYVSTPWIHLWGEIHEEYSMSIKNLKIWQKVIIALISFPLIIFLIGYIWLLSVSPGKTDPFTDENGNVLKGSIAEAYNIELGGVEQFVLARGRSEKNPILLILHGGPGDAEQHLFRRFNSDLENSYIVVNWDQRGCGRSYSKDISKETITLDQMISDAHELVSHLKQKFKKEKVFLLGHSWGSYLGMNVVDKYPDDFYAFVVVGQVADQVKSESLSYEFVLNKAKEDNNSDAIKELTEIGAPVNGLYQKKLMDIAVQRKWALEFGGTVYGKNRAQVLGMLLKPLMLHKEYRLKDKLNWPKGAGFVGPLLFPVVLKEPLAEKVNSIKVPYYLFQGKNDINTFYDVAKEFFVTFEAPKKEMFTFEKSSHFLPFNTEAEKFNEILMTKIIADTAFVNEEYVIAEK